MKKSIPKIREREGNKKIHSQISGMGREWKNPIPKIREREGNEKNPFPKFGNGKGMKKIHSRNSGTGREWKNPFPKFGKGNQRPSFLGMTGNGNSCSPLRCCMISFNHDMYFSWLLRTYGCPCFVYKLYALFRIASLSDSNWEEDKHDIAVVTFFYTKPWDLRIFFTPGICAELQLTFEQRRLLGFRQNCKHRSRYIHNRRQQ